MKQLFAMAVLCLLLTTKLKAQTMPEKAPAPVIITSFEITFPVDGRGAEFDSLLNIYVEKGIKPNPMIHNFRVLRHWWGSDNMRLLYVYEVDSWENINKAMDKTDELVEATMTDKDSRRKFWTRFNRYMGKHSDEIMADIGKPKM